MNNQDRANKLKMFRDDVNSKFTEDELTVIAASVNQEVSKIVFDFLFIKFHVIFRLKDHPGIINAVKAMILSISKILELSAIVGDDNIESIKTRNSLLFKNQVMFKKLSDYLKAKHQFEPDSQAFETSLVEALELQETTIASLMLKKIYPNEDIQKILQG